MRRGFTCLYRLEVSRIQSLGISEATEARGSSTPKLFQFRISLSCKAVILNKSIWKPPEFCYHQWDIGLREVGLKVQRFLTHSFALDYPQSWVFYHTQLLHVTDTQDWEPGSLSNSCKWGNINSFPAPIAFSLKPPPQILLLGFF